MSDLIIAPELTVVCGFGVHQSAHISTWRLSTVIKMLGIALGSTFLGPTERPAKLTRGWTSPTPLRSQQTTKCSGVVWNVLGHGSTLLLLPVVGFNLFRLGLSLKSVAVWGATYPLEGWNLLSGTLLNSPTYIIVTVVASGVINVISVHGLHSIHIVQKSFNFLPPCIRLRKVIPWQILMCKNSFCKHFFFWIFIILYVTIPYFVFISVYIFTWKVSFFYKKRSWRETEKLDAKLIWPASVWRVMLPSWFRKFAVTRWCASVLGFNFRSSGNFKEFIHSSRKKLKKTI